MINRYFSERLNQELDNIDFPQLIEDRIEAFSKLINIPRFQAEAILKGYVPSDELILQKIADELEIDRDWLLGADKDESH